MEQEWIECLIPSLACPIERRFVHFVSFVFNCNQAIMNRTVLFIATLLLSIAQQARADFIWWEAEQTSATNFPKTSDFSPSTFPDEASELSAGDWLSVSGKRGADVLFATYHIEIPADGPYHFWTRKFWKHGPFQWRVGQSPWQTCDRNVALADETLLRKFVCANWVSLGSIDLKHGQQTIEIRLLAGAGEDVAAAFDCFVLSRDLFTPNGKLKPGEKFGQSEDGYFPWEPTLDPFDESSDIDLRYLNEKVAGQNGFLKQAGDEIQLGDGQPVRFWGVNIAPNNVDQDHASVDFLARKLAKLGVNIVRIHGRILDYAHDPTPEEFKHLDNVMYAVAALKKQGIYTYLSFNFPLWFDMTHVAGVEGYDGIPNQHPFGILFFNPTLQAMYRDRAREILTAKNPYTGLSLGEDPALGVVEIINEDSLFFWTFDPKNVPLKQWKLLEGQFCKWLGTRYGSPEEALTQWGYPLDGDDLPSGRVALMRAWDLTAKGVANDEAKQRRAGDQARFFAETQRDFYATTTKYLRDTCKVGGLISASNWQTSDPRLFDALERWTYAPTNLMDRHGYFSGAHTGERAGFSVSPGDDFDSRAAVNVPEMLPIFTPQIAGHPQFISELGWTNPNRYRADAALVSAAYASSQGIDGLCWFAVGSNYLNDRTMEKFGVSLPSISGTFPATALMYRRGDVKQAQPAVVEQVVVENLFAMKGTSTVSPDALDALRANDVPPGAKISGDITALDPLAPLVGPVVRSFDGSEKLFQLNLSKYIDRDGKQVTSGTGELIWDYGNGVVHVRSKKCQAVTGFLRRAGAVELGGFQITCDNEYGSIIVISLDDERLEISKKILIQVMTADQPTGFRTEGRRIVDVGRSPYEVENIEASISWPRGELIALDENGVERETVQAKGVADDGATNIGALNTDAVYYLFIRD